MADANATTTVTTTATTATNSSTDSVSNDDSDAVSQAPFRKKPASLQSKGYVALVQFCNRVKKVPLPLFPALPSRPIST